MRVLTFALVALWMAAIGLEEKRFERVGGTQSLHVNVRVVAAVGCDKEYASVFSDPSAFTYGALRNTLIAYVPA